MINFLLIHSKFNMDKCIVAIFKMKNCENCKFCTIMPLGQCTWSSVKNSQFSVCGELGEPWK